MALVFYLPPSLFGTSDSIVTTPASSRQSAPAHAILALIGFLLLCYAIAGLGAILAVPAIPTWYAALAKPAFHPPNGIFGPVWTALYGLMAIAAWLVWRTPRTAARAAGLVLFAVQLVLNALWTPAFFHFHLLLPALVLIVVLWVTILFTTLRFWVVDRFAAALMLPYLAWVAFAAALNYEIYRLN